MTIPPDEPAQVQSVTSARVSAQEDRQARMKHYLITMSIRIICFVLAFATEGVVRWTCVALAVVLPYFAVIFANAKAPRTAGRVSTVTPRDPKQHRIGQ